MIEPLIEGLCQIRRAGASRPVSEVKQPFRGIAPGNKDSERTGLPLYGG